MELPEIEQLVGEAENRVERLRSLYDQYFMGIERIEPQTARKDVERRIQMLRKTQIRNTALRFRFQNVLLRYNTFSAHWVRICRQIEEGTYKHHLRKAKDRLDPLAAQRDARDARKKAAALEYGDTEPPGPPQFDVTDDLEVDVDFEDPVSQSNVRAALRSYAIPQEAMAPSVAGRAMQSMAGAAKAPAAQEPRRPVRDASLDRSTDPAPPPALPTAHSAVPARSLPAGKAPPLPPPVPTGGGRAPPGPPPARAAPATSGRPGPPPVPTRPSPAAAHAPRTVPAPAAPPARPTVPAPTAPPQRAAVASARPAPAPAPRAVTPATTSPKPAAHPATGAAGRAAQPAARPAGNPVDERTRQIYSKYVETKRSLGESTAAITMDSLAKSLKDSSEKLRQKHPGKKVDFEVQVKDGKTVLKPIVR